MKKIIIFLVFFVWMKTYSQNGRVIYIASSSNSFNETDFKSKSRDEIAFYNVAKNSSENFECELSFNKNISVFQVKDAISGMHKNNFTRAYVGRGIYYFNKKTNTTIEQKELFGETFLIDKENIKWNISNESKKVGKYNCIKATGIYYSVGRNGQIEQEIIAWFAPSFAINSGPKNFNGLPGLIISLEVVGRYFFNIVKIELDLVNDIIVKIPTKGERISQKTYDKIIKDYATDRSGFIYKRKKYFSSEK